MATLQQVIGARIRALRQQKGWTQEDLGGRSELDFTTIGGAERGEKSLSLKSLSRVAQALEVDLGDLHERLDLVLQQFGIVLQFRQAVLPRQVDAEDGELVEVEIHDHRVHEQVIGQFAAGLVHRGSRGQWKI